ncbi:MAG: aminotransferase class I/II-fold pyridoxal phosphate-dependent enzyme [Ignavibacteria bacterium]|nr:aminotransferase class I/II-fold pyridoxal phosphate-dependent enzyme [Ignavibacteria bacterium]MBT8391817.1 aminotransferase class I/II-fold pyridoxal phosphate-dependent enzyme [Ignavibacteria bacterium]NNJ51878.1 aminotransferase class I/II-fold pyridoxal phosphate-dependent enzyme [Ignavibacteriaceae bacterium]NNL21913.1 aminotransferase class I/II-fold pyridoxal phosphate-dependent enzyme [Ignavibacteriaceae bacterium]
MIDLRSDTVTKPSPEMRKAMYEAEVGDDVFKEDPTVNKLEEYIAELLSKDAALFVPSGVMGNQISLNVLTEPGDEVICDREAHIFNYESSSVARLSGIQIYPLDGELGVLTPAQVEPYIRTTAYHMPRTKVIEVENTHNRRGGTIWPIDAIVYLKNLAKKHGLYYHLDGARIWNAFVETGISPKEYASHFDSVSCCFSKGLGAPIGSAIAGSKEFIKEAYRVRKAWGGGMRQVGILAAAALYAVQHNIKRLKEDHRRAEVLAKRINENPSLEINMEAVHTNILLFKPLRMKPEEGLKLCKEKGLILTPGTINSLRAVTHLDVNDDDISKAANIIDEVFK